MTDSFKTRATLHVGDRQYAYHHLPAIPGHDLSRLPYSLKILLENLLRFEDGVNVTRADIEAVLRWDPKALPSYEIAFTPARVIMQDFTGVPCIVDLAAMREAIVRLGGDAQRVNPLAPAELVIDHSVQVDEYGAADALAHNTAIEFGRNGERYAFLRWGQTAFNNFKVVPPNTGIVHQVNLEHLGRVVFSQDGADGAWAYPDTLVGTDSHTTMINGLGVVGWGVGGIEAEAAMLGQPVTMLIPQVIGFRLTGALPPGTTATDLVLTITQLLRQQGVVDQFVEFFGDGLAALPLADRATISNMSPEFGSTIAVFPIDEETVRYLELTARPAEQVALVEAYARANGLWRTHGMPEADYTAVLTLDLGTILPSIAGPKRPQDRVLLTDAKRVSQAAVQKTAVERAAQAPTATGSAAVAGTEYSVKDNHVVIAAITSCTNTSNPTVLVAAGLLARAARARPDGQAVGENLACTRVARSHGLSEQSGSHERSGSRGLLYGRLRLHDLHRQLRAAQAGNLGRYTRGGYDHRLRALGQPQFRRPRPPGSEDELPRLPSVGGRVCTGRFDGYRSDHGTPGNGRDGRAGLPERPLAQCGRGTSGRRFLCQHRDVCAQLRQRLPRRCALERDRSARRCRLSVGGRVDLRA